jgi:hypothetical protein
VVATHVHRGQAASLMVVAVKLSEENAKLDDELRLITVSPGDTCVLAEYTYLRSALIKALCFNY